MNPLKLFTIYRRAHKLAGYFEEAQVSKSVFRSKLFWFNVLTTSAELANLIPLPPGTALIVSNLINIALRFVTDKPVHLVTPN